jgi:hypothetical protein
MDVGFSREKGETALGRAPAGTARGDERGPWRARVADRRLAREVTPGPGFFDELLTADDAATIGDLGGEGDELNEEREIATFRQWAREANRGRERPPRADHGMERYSGTDRATYLARRLEKLWREVEREASGHSSRLDEPAPPAAPSENSKAPAAKPNLDGAARHPASNVGGPFCPACGALLEGQGAALCRRCEAAKGAASLGTAPDSRRSEPPKPAPKKAARQDGGEKDPIDVFSEAELGPCDATDELPEPSPSKRKSLDASEGSWRRLFWFSVVLWACVGAAASVHENDVQARSLINGQVHAVK